MITETQTSIVVLHVIDELAEQLHPFMVRLGISVSSQSTQAVHHLCLTMPAEVYDTLVERVGTTLNYELRWRPSADEPDGFVERVRPLELINGSGGTVASGYDDAIAPF